MNLKLTEQQLKKRLCYPYKWYRKQNNLWDNYTNFIYKIPDWDLLIETISETVKRYKLDKKECFYYAINRWYNFYSAMAVEHIFCKQKNVAPALHQKNKEIDFYINTIPFDHKTSVFPKGFQQPLWYAKQNKKELLYWFYNQQSKQQREHYANRLFIVTHKSDGNHWKLKAEISLLEQAITKYVATFEDAKLETLHFSKTKNVLSDIIWVAQ